MNEFDKKYLEIAKNYNYKPNQIILENAFLDGLKSVGNWIGNAAKSVGEVFGDIVSIIRKGANALLELVTGWFKAENEENAKDHAEWAQKIVNYGAKNQIVTESFEWFRHTCNQVSTNFKLITSDAEKQKFLDYITKQKSYNAESWKSLQYSKKKEIFKEFVQKETASTITESKQIINEAASTIAILVIILLIIIALPIIFNWLDNRLGITNHGTFNKNLQEIKDKKEENAAKRAFQQEELNILLSGCTALQ